VKLSTRGETEGKKSKRIERRERRKLEKILQKRDVKRREERNDTEQLKCGNAK
jgi:hypothetical protein